jgi:plasmid maintenance system antidote protein VapI
MKIKYVKGYNPYSGFFSDPISAEGEAVYRKLMVVEELLKLMEEQGITRGELAKRMGVQPSRVTSMMTGANNFTIETLVRAGRAVGADIELRFVPMKAAKNPSAKPRKADAPRLTRVAEAAQPYRATRKPRKA